MASVVRFVLGQTMTERERHVRQLADRVELGFLASASTAERLDASRALDELRREALMAARVRDTVGRTVERMNALMAAHNTGTRSDG